MCTRQSPCIYFYLFYNHIIRISKVTMLCNFKCKKKYSFSLQQQRQNLLKPYQKTLHKIAAYLICFFLIYICLYIFSLLPGIVCFCYMHFYNNVIRMSLLTQGLSRHESAYKIFIFYFNCLMLYLFIYINYNITILFFGLVCCFHICLEHVCNIC